MRAKKSKKQTPWQTYQSSEDKKWYWNLKSENHEIVAQGEGYETHQGAEQGIKVVKRLVLKDTAPRRLLWIAAGMAIQLAIQIFVVVTS